MRRSRAARAAEGEAELRADDESGAGPAPPIEVLGWSKAEEGCEPKPEDASPADAMPFWTDGVPPPPPLVLSGHAASLTPY